MERLKKLVSEKKVFQNKNGDWIRFCPKCRSPILYLGKDAHYRVVYAFDRSSSCKNCQKISISNKLKNHVVLEETKQKIREKRKLQVITEETRQKLSKSSKGRKYPPITEETRQKMSISHQGKTSNRKGIKLSEETKCKCRIAHINRLNRLGLKSENKDFGADNFFKKINEVGLYNFQQEYYIKDLGYWVDGFDEKNRIILEYDTKYHKKPSQKIRDEIRQNNIMNYFDKIGNPISFFVRVDASNKVNAFNIQKVLINLFLMS